MARSEKNQPTRLSSDDLDVLEEEIELLKVAYERYFNGVDRVPPGRQHDAVKRHVRQMQRHRGTTTAIRFRANTLKARLITYEQYWNRILNQIEKGTFKRVLAEAGRREREAQRRLVEQVSEPRAEDAEGAEAEPDAPRRRSARRSSSSAGLPEGVDAREARALYKEFIAAKKAAGESISGLTYGKLVAKLAREVPRLQQKHGSSIRFEVATTRDGKVRLRARRGQKAS